MKSTLFATTETNFLPPIGYNKILDNISNLVKSQKLPSSNIIYAPEGSGKRLFCEYIASIILEAENSSYSKIDMHPDLLIIDNKDQTSSKKEITVDLTRKIKDFIHLTPSQANAQVIIIDSIDKLNKNAANSILKILEEPPKNRYFLLICHNLSTILDTIKSRCNKVKLPALSKQDFFEIISLNEDIDISKDDLELLYKIFPEQPGIAISFIENKGIETFQAIQDINNSTSNNLFLEIKKFSNEYDWKNIELFNNFFTIINHLIYQKVIFFNEKQNHSNVEKLQKLNFRIQKDFFDTVNLNLDRKNYVITVLQDLSNFR